MFSNILLIAVGVVFVGLMFYSFFSVLFSKKEYKNIPKPDHKKAPGIPDNKLRGRFIGRT